MCGIFGIISKNTAQNKGVLTKALDSIKYRGPDDRGEHYFNNCALGHTRFSIVDVATGHQPMLSKNKSIEITFNGEIYGYREIKKNLPNYQFITQSDTEVIIALYEKYGENFIKHLPGMFALGLWDEDNQTLICTRDRFGEKPLYYAFGKNNEFIFASEIKAILSTGLVSPVINSDSVKHYLRFLYVNPQNTIYKNVYTLPPSSYLLYKNGSVEIKKYWELPEIDNSISFSEAVEKFKYLFEKSVEKQLVADCPVGAFLSGGLDSSTVVAVASKFTNRLKTISFGFNKHTNELGFAKQISKKYNTDHLELTDDFDIAELLTRMDSIYDEPFGDSSNIPTYLISNLASKHLKVVLTGDGGDEMLGGYGWYKPYLYMNENGGFGKIPPSLLYFFQKVAMRTGLSKDLDRLYKYKGQMFARAGLSLLDAHKSQQQCFSGEEVEGLTSPPINAGTEWSNIEGSRLNDLVSGATELDIKNYMPGDILVKLDRASMASPIELRAPFLDFDFASFCLSLPSKFKVTKKSDKLILREAFGSYWTNDIRGRNKQGFGAPINDWIQRKSVKKLRDEIFSNKNENIFNLISFDLAKKYIKNNNYRSWALLVLAIWARNHNFVK